MTNWYDKHAPSCTVWDTPINDLPRCTCTGYRREGGTPPDGFARFDPKAFLDDILEGLESGLSTDQIADGIGCEYDSLLTRVRRRGETELQSRLIALRAQEWDYRRRHLVR